MKTTIQHFENRAGGKGWIHIEHLLDSDALGTQMALRAHCTRAIIPGRPTGIVTASKIRAR